MRRPLRFVALAVIALGLLALGGCDAGREVLNPYAGIDHDYRYVGHVDTIPMNGR